MNAIICLQNLKKKSLQSLAKFADLKYPELEIRLRLDTLYVICVLIKLKENLLEDSAYYKE